MQEEDIDIVELILERMPEKTEEQQRIKMYMMSHKTNCNRFIYEKYTQETTFFNTILKSLMLDLGREILEVIYKDDVVKKIEFNHDQNCT